MSREGHDDGLGAVMGVAILIWVVLIVGWLR